MHYIFDLALINNYNPEYCGEDKGEMVFIILHITYVPEQCLLSRNSVYISKYKNKYNHIYAYNK